MNQYSKIIRVNWLMYNHTENSKLLQYTTGSLSWSAWRPKYLIKNTTLKCIISTKVSCNEWKGWSDSVNVIQSVSYTQSMYLLVYTLTTLQYSVVYYYYACLTFTSNVTDSSSPVFILGRVELIGGHKNRNTQTPWTPKVAMPVALSVSILT